MGDRCKMVFLVGVVATWVKGKSEKGVMGFSGGNFLDPRLSAHSSRPNVFRRFRSEQRERKEREWSAE